MLINLMNEVISQFARRRAEVLEKFLRSIGVTEENAGQGSFLSNVEGEYEEFWFQGRRRAILKTVYHNTYCGSGIEFRITPIDLTCNWEFFNDRWNHTPGEPCLRDYPPQQVGQYHPGLCCEGRPPNDFMLAKALEISQQDLMAFDGGHWWRLMHFHRDTGMWSVELGGIVRGPFSFSSNNSMPGGRIV